MLKRERPLSAITMTNRPYKSSRTADGKTTYHLDSEDEEESAEAPTLQVAFKKETKVEVIDLLD